MSIKNVDIQYDPNTRLIENFHVPYQNASMFITLAISDWLRKQAVEIEKTNRIIFTEKKPQFTLVGIFDKHVLVKVDDEFNNLAQFNSAEATYDYFKRKYIEGFKRFDAHFGLNLTPDLITFLDDYFKDGYVYEKEMKSKRVNGLKHQVLKQYQYDVFNLVLRVFDKAGNLLKERVLQSGIPDPFLVHYNVNKVNILDDKIEVLGSTGKVETEHALDPTLH